MFLEPQAKKGWIEVVCGSMFSGKTEELIRRLKRAQIANLNILIVKPKIDVRYDEKDIVSHDASSIPSIPVQSSQDILEMAEGMDIVGVDEVQFFDEGITQVCEQLALQGCRVIVAGLDMDYTGKPFGPMPQILAVAEYVTKLHAICVQCGYLASHSFRKIKTSQQIELGSQDIYEARCRICFDEGQRQQEAMLRERQHTSSN